MAKLRLNKILAQAGLASRRGADRLITAGRVAVHGDVVREVGTLADPDRDAITVDGRPIPAAEAKLYVLLHKPRGYLCSRADPRGRPVVTDLVPVGARLYPVGRLDVEVEGVLLLTNDGALTHRLLHPRYGLPRLYQVDVAGAVRRADLGRWRRGVTLEDGPAAPAAVELVQADPTGSRLRLTFTEGRKHEVKRYCEALGHRVRRLRRLAFGPLTLGNLPAGAWRRLTSREVAVLRRVAAAPPAAER
jgi:23S rRNA pseudouridine2605 synthase